MVADALWGTWSLRQNTDPLLGFRLKLGVFAGADRSEVIEGSEEENIDARLSYSILCNIQYASCDQYGHTKS